MAMPNKIVEVLKTDIQAQIDGIETTFERTPSHLDPHCSAYVLPGVRRPHDKCIGHREPNLQTLDVLVVFMVKHSSEEEGQQQIDDITSNLWALIYSEPDLSEHLRALEDISFGMTRRVTKWDISTQHYSPQIEVDGVFVSASTTNIRFDISASG